MFIYSCKFVPICFNKSDVRLYGLDHLIRARCADCPFGGNCHSVDDVPDGVWYTTSDRDLYE